MMILAAPPALVWVKQEDSDLKKMPLADIHKEALAALKKAGYKRTRVEEDDFAIIGSSTEVDLLSPDGKEKISLTFSTEDDSTVERETLVPQRKAEAYDRYKPLLKEKFPDIQLICSQVGGKTYASVQVELSEANVKNVLTAMEETKKAIALIEANQGAAVPAPVSSNPLAATLTETGLKYEDIGGLYYKLIYDHPEGRKQTVYTRKTEETYLSLKVREVFSLCYDEKEAPSTETLLTVFQKRHKIGGYVLEAPSATQTNWRIRFRAMIPSDTSPQKLKEAIEIVEYAAEEMEKTLTKEDKL